MLCHFAQPIEVADRTRRIAGGYQSERIVIQMDKEPPDKPLDINYGIDTESCTAECLQNLVRERAYEFYERRGRLPGYEVADWLSAEQ